MMEQLLGALAGNRLAVVMPLWEKPVQALELLKRAHCPLRVASLCSRTGPGVSAS